MCDCVSGVQCGFSVTYSSTSVCGLKGTSVVLPCTYQYSNIGYYRGEQWYKDDPKRIVRQHSDFDYPDCSLKIDKLSDDHSGVYYYRFYTNRYAYWIIGRPGIKLSVTGSYDHIHNICITL